MGITITHLTAFSTRLDSTLPTLVGSLLFRSFFGSRLVSGHFVVSWSEAPGVGTLEAGRDGNGACFRTCSTRFSWLGEVFLVAVCFIFGMRMSQNTVLCVYPSARPVKSFPYKGPIRLYHVPVHFVATCVQFPRHQIDQFAPPMSSTTGATLHVVRWWPEKRRMNGTSMNIRLLTSQPRPSSC